MRTKKNVKWLLAICLIAFCSMLSFACRRIPEEKQKNIEYSYVDGELKIDGEEYIAGYRREIPTTWRLSPTEKEKWVYFGTVNSAGRDYKFYQYIDYEYIRVNPEHGLFDDVMTPTYIYQKKDIHFPEISLETIDQVLLVENIPSITRRLTKPNIDKETIEKCIKIILENTKQEMTDDKEFSVILINNDMPYYASWHQVIENDGQYYLETDAENHYASISRELLEEIAGGSLDNIPWQKK
ncbi:MAG: hypothetical protein LBN26_03270 [Christensenellaceae bacterium]|jgi:hypothetical protein|nr:hypothetical protein [Christensenellaceae bacterium]